MKIKAMTMAEIIVAMSFIAVLSIIGINTYKANIPNSDLIKFKHVYGTISALISQMLSDKELYPDAKGFANTASVISSRTGAAYGGATKFHFAFKEKINVLEENIKISENNMPMYQTKSGNIVTANEVTCFTNNSGITFCPPETPVDGSLDKIYLRVHVNDNYNIQNAIYFLIYSNGKIEFPSTIEGKIACMLNTKNSNMRQNNQFYHCAIISSLDSM